MQEQPAIIRQKISAPTLPESYIPRPRLETRIVELVEARRVVLVSATAGSGKTSAVTSALAGISRPVAWLTLDDTDCAPGRLLTYLEAALVRHMPAADGVTARALAARVLHPEAAGMLADALDRPIVLVIDDAERVSRAPDALAVLETFIKYAHREATIVLISRRAMPLRIDTSPLTRTGAVLNEQDLAFTSEEAAVALGELRAGEIDPAKAVAATGGWVTGVLFEAWRSTDHIPGMGGEADPLDGYLSTHILQDLTEAERDFLIDSSVLDHVTTSRAEDLGLAKAGRVLESLRLHHLPVVWDATTGAMRCHPRFREYLLGCLERRGTARARELRRTHAELLERDGFLEEATEEALSADAVDIATRTAGGVIESVIDRLDFNVAVRWLQALAATGPLDAGPLTVARLMLAVGREDYRSGVRIADELRDNGMRESLAQTSSRAAAMMAWSYFHSCRLEDLHEVLAVAPQGPDMDAVRYLLTLVDNEPAAAEPIWQHTASPVASGLVARLHYWRGRFDELLEGASESRWAEAVSTPWRIAALRVTGQTERALELYRESEALESAEVGLHAVVVPELFIDLGRADDAAAALRNGRAIAQERGSLVWEIFNQLAQAKYHLRIEHDPASAIAVLDRLEQDPATRRYGSTAEQLDACYGVSQLLLGQNEAALERLRRATATMDLTGRLLEMPAAAVYLAEAAWRANDEQAADEAADMALRAAESQGSDYLLLGALSEFPAVLSRRLDLERDSDSAWHRLGRALISRGAALGWQHGGSVKLMEFGRIALLVDGVEVKPRIMKSYELLAILSTSPQRSASRDTLLDALFESRLDESARAYLRQAVYQLRDVLPGGAGPTIEKGVISLGEVEVETESTRLEAQMSAIASLPQGQRLDAIRDALRVLDSGEYLPGVRTNWAESRREQFRRAANDLRVDAAELLLEQGGYQAASALAERVLDEDPFREAPWRVLMRAADALGAHDRVIEAYRSCERTLHEVGVTPSPSTKRLLEQLRR